MKKVIDFGLIVLNVLIAPVFMAAKIGYAGVKLVGFGLVKAFDVSVLLGFGYLCFCFAVLFYNGKIVLDYIYYGDIAEYAYRYFFYAKTNLYLLIIYLLVGCLIVFLKHYRGLYRV